jgi:hypothetical protein
MPGPTPSHHPRRVNVRRRSGHLHRVRHPGPVPQRLAQGHPNHRLTGTAPFWGCGPQAPIYGGRGPHAPRAGDGRLGVGAHRPRSTRVVAHAPHARTAIRASKRRHTRKSHHDVTPTRLSCCAYVTLGASVAPGVRYADPGSAPRVRQAKVLLGRTCTAKDPHRERTHPWRGRPPGRSGRAAARGLRSASS